MQFQAVMRRQYRIGGFAIGGDYYGSALPPVVDIEFLDAEFVIQRLDRKGQPKPESTRFWPNSWTWRYSEVKSAQVIVLTAWVGVGMTDHKKVPHGIRLDMGESRSYLILVSREFNVLLDAFASHGVPVDRKPRRVNFFLVGRR